MGGWWIVGRAPPWSAPRALVNAGDIDVVALELPQAQLVHATESTWNPYVGLGEPIGWVDWPTRTHAPAWLLYRALPPAQATALASLLHVLGGGIAALLFLRWRGHGASAALAGAIAFELSPFFTGYLARPWITAAMPWSMLALWSAEALGRRPGPRPAAGLAASIGGALLCAVPHLAALIGLLAPALGLVAARRGDRARAAGLGLAALALAGALGAPRALPLLAMMSGSNRPRIPFAEWHDRTLRVGLEHALPLVVPDANGHPMRGTHHGRWYGGFSETRVYLGLPVLVLALAGVRRSTRRFAVGMGVMVLLALPTPASAVLYAIPGFAGTSVARALWALPLLAPPLVAAGAAALRAGERRVLVAAALALGAVLVVSATVTPPGPWPGGPPLDPPPMLDPLVGPQLLAVATLLIALAAVRGATSSARRLALAAAIGLASGELLREAHVQVVTTPAGEAYRDAPQVERLARAARGDHALVAPPLDPNVFTRWGVRGLGAYGSSHSARLVALLDRLGQPTPVRQYLTPADLPPAWRDALAVRAVFAATVFDAPARPGLELVEDEAGGRIWSNPTALPRARLHPLEAAIEVPDAAASLERVARAGFDPRRQVVLETGADVAPTSADPPPPTPVELVVDEPERVVVRVTAPQGGVLVLADSYARGWSVDDGLELLPAQHALRGVRLPAGFAGDVTFTWRVPRLRASLALCAVALAVVVLAWRADGRSHSAAGLDRG